MALDSYSALQTAIANLLNRTDLTSAIPDFITLCEAAIKRDLRRTTKRQQYTINAIAWTMPSEIGELLSIRLVSGTPSLDLPLYQGTPEDANTLRASLGDVTGRPVRCWVVGRDVIFAPTPDTAYTIEVSYVQALTPLSDSNTTNAVLQEAPDVYLYGAAMHAAPYLGDDERVPLWRDLYQYAIQSLNEKRAREEYGASLHPVRLPRVFG